MERSWTKIKEKGEINQKDQKWFISNDHGKEHSRCILSSPRTLFERQ